MYIRRDYVWWTHSHGLHNIQPPQDEVKGWPKAVIKPTGVAWHAEGANENAQVVQTVEVGEAKQETGSAIEEPADAKKVDGTKKVSGKRTSL